MCTSGVTLDCPCDVSCGCAEVRRGMLCVGAVPDTRVSGRFCLCDRCGVSPKCDESVSGSLRDR